MLFCRVSLLLEPCELAIVAIAICDLVCSIKGQVFELLSHQHAQTPTSQNPPKLPRAFWERSARKAPKLSTIDKDMKAKRDNIISELITLRITKAKPKENSGRGGVDEIHLKLAVIPKNIGINKFQKAKAKAKKHVGGINFTLISVSTVKQFFPSLVESVSEFGGD